MLKKTIKYRDLDDNEITDDFYFNLTRADILELEADYDGGLKGMIEHLIQSDRVREVMPVFRQIISKSLGYRSADGKSFVRDYAFTEKFLNSDAYSELIVELMTNPDKGAEFFNALVPKRLNDGLPATPQDRNLPLN